jgi:hypothetical protein
LLLCNSIITKVIGLLNMENFYICRYCRACYSDSEVDCFECEGEGCCYLYQAETYEEALEMSYRAVPVAKILKN